MRIGALQLYLGPQEREWCTPSALGDLLRHVFSGFAVPRLLVWNCLGPAWLDAVHSACSNSGVDLHAWYPVLADRLDGECPEDALVESPWGHRGRGTQGFWSGMDGGEERFRFRSPRNALSDERFVSSLEILLDSGAYCGVFLDRIRFPSPANGIEMLFASCRDPDPSEAGGILRRLRETERESDGISSWEEFYRILDLENVFRERSDWIGRATETLADPVRSRGLQLGADLYSPSIAPLVGQDYSRFASICDWIKPMTYFRACGPAGLPLEIGSFLDGLCGLGGWKRESALGLVRRITGLGVEDRPTNGLPGTASVSGRGREVEAALRVGKAAGCRICPGIEAVRHPRFKPAVDAAMLGASLEELRGLAEEIVPSWNVLYIPEDNLKTVADFAAPGADDGNR